MNEVLQRVYQIGIIPVIAIDDADKAVPLAQALVKGGLPAAEVTFRTAAGEEAIRRIAAEVPDMLVGAGTVLTTEQADRAIAAGAQFIVSPGFNPVVTRYVIDKGVPMMPGTATPGEMEQAMSMGLDVVKFFPAEQNGGVAKLKAVAGPYTTLRWMPTGGVNTKNMMDYLSFDKIIACGGTWMVKKDLIEGEKTWASTAPTPARPPRPPRPCALCSAWSTRRATPPTSPAPWWSATRPLAGAPTATSPSAPTMWTGRCTTWASRASALTRPAAKPTPRATPRPSTSRTRWAASPSTW